MRLPFKRPPDTVAGPDAVQAARTRARRRLIGALVLLVAGVIGFPLLFETTPRPVAPDTPIVMSPRGSAPSPQTRSEARSAAPAEGGVEPAQPAASVARPPPAGGAPERSVAAPPPKPAAGPPTGAAPRAAPASAPVAVARTAPSPTAQPRASASAPSATDDAARARALLEGRTVAPAAAPAPAAGGRFVVQVGAYTDPATLREARARVEKLGLKTYTQAVQVDGSTRTRVRVGPFASRDEALAVADRLKGAGLPANVLAL